jgi:hypothetical protein
MPFYGIQPASSTGTRDRTFSVFPPLSTVRVLEGGRGFEDDTVDQVDARRFAGALTDFREEVEHGFASRAKNFYLFILLVLPGFIAPIQGITPKEKRGYSPAAERKPVIPPTGGSGFVPPPASSNKN